VLSQKLKSHSSKKVHSISFHGGISFSSTFFFASSYSPSPCFLFSTGTSSFQGIDSSPDCRTGFCIFFVNDPCWVFDWVDFGSFLPLTCSEYCQQLYSALTGLFVNWVLLLMFPTAPPGPQPWAFSHHCNSINCLLERAAEYMEHKLLKCLFRYWVNDWLDERTICTYIQTVELIARIY